MRKIMSRELEQSILSSTSRLSSIMGLRDLKWTDLKLVS